METQQATHAYRVQQAAELSPIRGVAVLYDRAIESLRLAQHAIDIDDINMRWRANRKACDILIGLSTCLDHKLGGEIAANLSDLYRFMLIHLMRVDVDRDKKAAEDVIGLLKPLAQSWHQLADQADEDPEKIERAVAAARRALGADLQAVEDKPARDIQPATDQPSSVTTNLTV